jgi:hypothetical protein
LAGKKGRNGNTLRAKLQQQEGFLTSRGYTPRPDWL